MFTTACVTLDASDRDIAFRKATGLVDYESWW